MAWRMQIAAAAFAVLLAGCSAQPSGSTDAASAPVQSTPVAQSTPAADANATASPPPQQNLSVDDLLAHPAAQTAAEHAQEQEQGTPASAGSEPAPPAAASADAVADAGDDAAYARVVSVTKLSGPRQVCTDHTIIEHRHPHDRHRVAGTVIGGVVGGLIGNTIGGGSGRALATAGGAVAGGLVGRHIQREHQRRDTITRVVRRCRPVAGGQEGVALYDVVYAYQGRTFHARLDHDPGERVKLPVRSVE